MGFLHAIEKGKSCSELVEGAQFKFLSRSSSLSGHILWGLGKAFHLLIALVMLPIDGPFPP